METMTPENIACLKELIEQNPRMSTREPAADLSLPHTAVYEILKKDLMSCDPQQLGTSPALREEQEGESRVLSGADYAVPDLWIRFFCLPSVSTG